jgi:hypothetical protein
MKKTFLKSVIILSFLLNTTQLMAQDPPADPGSDPDVPIDGGISLLLAAGAGYGIKKIKDNMNKKEDKH